MIIWMGKNASFCLKGDQNMKKLTAFLLAALLLFSSVPAFSAASIVGNGALGKNITWTLSDDGVLTVSGTGDMPDGENDSP